jgi:hypothetical protein
MQPREELEQRQEQLQAQIAARERHIVQVVDTARGQLMARVRSVRRGTVLAAALIVALFTGWKVLGAVRRRRGRFTSRASRR